MPLDRPAGSSQEPAFPLTVVSPSGDRSVVEVDRSPFRIGRLSECELTLRDTRISRNHAQILKEGDSYYIEDCDSRHGLYVNGERQTRRRLSEGDRIEFGVADSYRIFVGAEAAYSAPLMKKVAELEKKEGAGSLGRLSAVLDMARALQSSGSVDEVLAAAVDAALAVTKTDRGFLMLLGAEGELEVKVARDRNGRLLEADEMRVPRQMIWEALQRRRDMFSLSFDGSEDPRAAGRTAAELELRSVICVPLVKIRLEAEGETSVLSSKDDTLGVLYMDSREVAGDLPAGKRELLQSLAIEISTVLENARLLEEQRKKHDLEHELQIAREIQRALLPARLPQAGWLVAAGSSESCFDVGGDYYDVMPLSDDCWGAVLADVSGKGVSAALLTSLLQGAFFSATGIHADISESIGRINRYICERSRNARFATVFYCLIGRDGRLRFINAGHCPGLIARRGGGVEWLPPKSTPIGLFAEGVFPQEEARLEPGDKLVLYSDGVPESQNVKKEQFGDERLARLVMENQARGASDIAELVLSHVKQFIGPAPQKDDITLLVLGFEG